jgi:hypothetical protein
MSNPIGYQLKAIGLTLCLSVTNREEALLNQDAASAKDAASKLKGPYCKLFAKLG